MQKETVIYNGKKILKHHFRVYIYAKDGVKMLVNSWDEFRRCIDSGDWFENINDAPIKFELPDGMPEKLKRGRKKGL